MAVINKLLIDFQADITATNVIYFEVFNRGTTTTTSYTYTFVDTNRQINEVFTGTFGVVGEGSAINLKDAIETDYGSSIEFTITRSADILTLTGESSDIFFQNATYNGSTTPSDVKLTYRSESIEPEPTTTAYYFEFKDVKDIQHRVNIYKANTTPEYVQVEGNCTLESQDDEDTMTSLRPQMLNVNLLANTSLTFEDLYTEQERVYKVEYIRNSVTEFVGWLSPEGLYENYVEDKWYINLQAIDGLGYLEDIAYTNQDRLLFSGKQSFIEIITNCLAKTNLELPFRTSVNVYYDGLSGVDVLSNIYANSERFVNNDDNDALSCKEVLKSCLELFNATLLQNGGYWYIYRPIEAHDNTNITFYNYDKDGVLISGTETIAKDISFSLGSQIDSYYPHHANANQQKSIKRSLGAYRVNLQYGLPIPLNGNPNLNWNTVSSIDNWNIVGTEIVAKANLNGFVVYQATANAELQAETDYIPITDNGFIEFNCVLDNPSDVIKTAAILRVVYKKNSNYYYLKVDDGTWSSGTAPGTVLSDGNYVINIDIGIGVKGYNISIKSQEVPEPDGEVKIMVYNASSLAGNGVINYDVLSVYNKNVNNPSKGTNYTIEKAENYTPATDDVKKVLNGDTIDAAYYSTIYKNDQTTPTETWNRSGVTELKPILRIMAEDRVRMGWNPRIMFEGDVFGFVPLFSVININNVKEKMLPVNWVYDAYNNVTTLKNVELLNYDFQDDEVLYAQTEDYGETVKPKIRT